MVTSYASDLAFAVVRNKLLLISGGLLYRRTVLTQARRLEGVIKSPHQKQHDGYQSRELEHGVADDVARFQAKDAEYRKHPKRMDQVRQRFGRVVNLDDPAQMDLQRFGGLQYIRRFDEPPAAG